MAQLNTQEPDDIEQDTEKSPQHRYNLRPRPTMRKTSINDAILCTNQQH